MDLQDFCDGSVWAIAPEAMDQMLTALPGLLRTERIDTAAVKVREEQAYEPELTVRDGVAVIPVTGSISKRAGFLSFLFGGASIDRIRADLDAAMADRRVRAAVLYVDSPGGRVTGVSELAEHIHGMRGKKPVVAFSDGQITSAAAWIGSASERVMVSPTAQAGSIGVMTVHADLSKMDEKAGVKITYLTAGKYKALGNDAEPLSDEAREMIEARLNQTYEVFIAAMARYRGVETERVRADMAEGRIFIGSQAVDAGLADGLGSLDEAIEIAGALAGGKTKTLQGVSAMNFDDIQTAEQLQEAFPQLTKQIADQAEQAGRAAADVDTACAEAVSAERERASGLVKVHFGEQAGDKFAPILQNGFSVEQYQQMRSALGGGAAAGGGDPDGDFRESMREGIAGASAPDPGASGGGASGPQSWSEAVSAIQTEKGCTKTHAMKQAVKQYPELYQAYLDSCNGRQR